MKTQNATLKTESGHPHQPGPAMRFLMLMIPKVYQPDTPEGEKAGDGFTPPAAAVEAMMNYNEELAHAGALVALDGLHPPREGARVAFSGGDPVSTDGPFIESKEVIGGYWIIDVPSKKDAVDWALKCPAANGDVIEIRRIFEMEDFPEDVRKVADNPVVNEQIARKR